MPSFIVIGYFIDNYGYSFIWSSVIAISIVAAIGLYVMTTKNKQGPEVAIEKYT